MTKKELLQKADELIAKANELKELANNQDYILVPDKIKITKSIMWDSMWIENQNKELRYNYLYQNWAVSCWFYRDHLIKCKLTPYKYEDLNPWDLFYRSDDIGTHFECFEWYAIKLNDNSYQHWNNGSCMNNNTTDWNHYWKVEAI